MPNKIKHSRETRERLVELWNVDREPVKYATGKYTIVQISAMTGVPKSTAQKIIRGDL